SLRIDLVPAPLTAPGVGDLVDFNAILSRLSVDRRNKAAREEQTLLLDALIASVALQSLDRFIERGCPFWISELVEAGQIAPDAVGLAASLLGLLERFGAATRVDTEWRIEPSNDLPDTSEVWRSLLAEAPDLVAELALVAAIVEELPEILVDGPKRSDAPLSPMVEQLLQASPASASDIELLCDALAEIAKAWPKSRPLRILELGSNLGCTTGRIIHRLARSGAAIAYTAACSDAEQAARSRYLAEPQLGFACCRWTPRDGIEALNGANKFDIVLAVNSCSRLQLDTASLLTLRDLLVSGGLFLAMEPEPNPLWDVVFGQNLSWWQEGTGGYRVARFFAVAVRRRLARRTGTGRISIRRRGEHGHGPMAERSFLGHRAIPRRARPLRPQTGDLGHDRRWKQLFPVGIAKAPQGCRPSH
ncbi:MAG: class I SAM-dependent methyltransferase, partial [Alphaproteobacteria bacterium]|nr:class I SAM-dependent methyltransferase [Alphaproteobacteria bacterium]